MAKKKPDDFVPIKNFPEGHRHSERKIPRCQAWSPRQGRQCLGIARPNGMCRVHGGSAASGIAAPNYKHGKYVKNLPQRYGDNYTAAINDPDYLKLQDEIGLIDARLGELTANIDSKSSATIFGDLTKTVNDMEQARAALLRSQNISDEEKRAAAREQANREFLDNVSEIARLVRYGAQEWHVWKDITQLIEHRRRVVETERRLLVDMELLVRVEDTFVRFDILMDSIKQNVHDRKTRAAIQADYNRAIGR